MAVKQHLVLIKYHENNNNKKEKTKHGKYKEKQGDDELLRKWKLLIATTIHYICCENYLNIKVFIFQK